jgi:hypothetical protein
VHGVYEAGPFDHSSITHQPGALTALALTIVIDGEELHLCKLAHLQLAKKGVHVAHSFVVGGPQEGI